MSVHPEDFTPDIFSLSIPVPALDVVIFTIYRGSLCVVAIDATPGVAGVDRARLPG